MEFIIGLLVLVLDIIAIMAVLGSSNTTAMKLVWVVIILLLPIVGMLLWFFIGAKQKI